MAVALASGEGFALHLPMHELAGCFRMLGLWSCWAGHTLAWFSLVRVDSRLYYRSAPGADSAVACLFTAVGSWPVFQERHLFFDCWASRWWLVQSFVVIMCMVLPRDTCHLKGSFKRLSGSRSLHTAFVQTMLCPLFSCCPSDLPPWYAACQVCLYLEALPSLVSMTSRTCLL